MLLLMLSTALARVTNRNAGSSNQNSAPRDRPNSGRLPAGILIQGASSINAASYRPKNAAATHPAAMPISGAQSCRRPFAPKTRPTNTSRVSAALTGAAAGGAPSVANVSMSKATGMTATAISISTTPDTTGVIMRRSHDRRPDSTSCTSAQTITRFITSATPPCESARTQTAMAGVALPEIRTCPAPKRPKRKACSIVTSPQTSNAAKTAQDR